MSSKKIACVRLVALCLISCHLAEAADLPAADQLQKLGLELRWKNQATLDVGRDSVSYVTNDEDNLYVQSSAGVLSVFDAENGNKLWDAQVGRNDEPAMAVTSNNDLVVVVVGPIIYGFNKFTGRSMLEHRLTGQPSASPAMNEDTIFVPITGGAVYAYSLNVLKYKYRYGTLPDTAPRSFAWRFICGEEILTQPVVGKRAIAFATQAGNLHSVEITGTTPGRSRFQLLLNEPASAPLAIAANETSSSVVVLTGDNQAFSLDLVKGTAEWVYPVGRNMIKQPIAVGDEVYVVTTEGTLTRITRDASIPLQHGRPIEIPQYMAPNRIGVAIEAADLDAALQQSFQLPVAKAVRVLDIAPDSAAARSGLAPGDIIVRIDGLTSSSIEEARDLFAELPPRVQRIIEVIREGKLLRLKLQIPVKEWDVRGVQGVTAIGRFNVYGLDLTNRLVAYDLSSAEQVGRLSITGFNYPHQNFVTDQLYLVASNGELACLREIGPTVRVPDLGPTSRSGKVVSIKANVGDPSSAGGTVVCEVELADGTITPVTSQSKGVFREIYVQTGDLVTTNSPVALVGDDKFASYYRNPADRPVDVELAEPQPAADDPAQ